VRRSSGYDQAGTPRVVCHQPFCKTSQSSRSTSSTAIESWGIRREQNLLGTIQGCESERRNIEREERAKHKGKWLLTGVGHVATRRGHGVERKEREREKEKEVHRR